MPSGDTELRLLWTVLLNGTVFLCAFRFATRIGRDTPRVQQVADALLLTYLVQYVSVGLPGVLGILSPGTIGATALVCSGALIFPSLRRSKEELAAIVEARQSTYDSVFRDSLFAGLCVFAICYLAANVLVLRFQPIIATDALAYHFPAALQWLRTGHLAIFPTWFFNPANTYSPLAGSAFIAWLMAAEGNDVIARFVQTPVMLLIFFATVQICRSVFQIWQSTRDSALPIAGVIGVGVIACRPLLGEAAIGKDDLFLTAFLIAGIAGFAPGRLRDRFGPWRIGIAIGLCLATKYTSLLALPLFALLIDAPFRAGWRRRQFAVSLGVIALIAGPWFMRNLWMTGNPLYPLDIRVGGHTILHGLFRARRSADLRSLSGVWQVLTERYHSIPRLLLCVLAFSWFAAIVVAGGRLLREPIVRIVVLGPPIGITLFIALSPYPEVRFIFSSLVLLFVAATVALSGGPGLNHCVRIGWTLLIAIVSVTTGYRARGQVAECAGCSLAFAAAGACLYIAQGRRLHWPVRVWMGILITTAVAGSLVAYVYWNAYVSLIVGNSAETTEPYNDLLWWRSKYPPEAEAWNYVRTHTPPDAIIAYANTSLVYPLSHESRRPIYIPTRPGVHSLHDLPHFPTPVTGEEIIPSITDLLDSETDAKGWLDRLLASGAGYLVVAKHDAGRHPPEIPLARADRNHFRPVFEDDHYVIFQVEPAR